MRCKECGLQDCECDLSAEQLEYDADFEEENFISNDQRSKLIKAKAKLREVQLLLEEAQFDGIVLDIEAVVVEICGYLS